MSFLYFFHAGVAEEAAVLGKANIDGVVGKVVVAAEENHLAEKRVARFAKRLVD